MRKKSKEITRVFTFLILVLAGSCRFSQESQEKEIVWCLLEGEIEESKIDECYKVVDELQINKVTLKYLLAAYDCEVPPYLVSISENSNVFYIEETITRIKSYASDFVAKNKDERYFDQKIRDYTEFYLYKHFVECLESYLVNHESLELHQIISFVNKANIEKFCDFDGYDFTDEFVKIFEISPKQCITIVPTHMGNYRLIFYWDKDTEKLYSKIIVSDTLKWEL